MPESLVTALIDSEKFGQGFDTTEYLAAAMLDLSWHSLEAGEHITDVLSFESEVLAAAGFTDLVPPRYRTTYFGHIFASGYAAGYYSYLYSEVIAAWVSEWFEAQGGLNREAGDAFREAILAPGYSIDPMSAIERFFGTRPDVAPLLRRRGLAEPVEESAPAEEPAEEPTEVDAAEPKGHRNHAAVSQVLEANGIEPQIRLFTDATPTAASAAEKVGVEVGAIANSLIFSAEGEPVLIMTSGRHRVDTDFVAGLIGLSSLDRADKDLVRTATGQVIGGVAPCGHPQPIPTYVDVALKDYPVLWAAAGTPNSMMPLTYEQLLAITGGRKSLLSKKVPKPEGSDEPSTGGPEALSAAGRLAAFASSRGRYYAVILAVFSAVLIISNISATKVIGFGPIVTDGGAFLFPIAYILGDVISEVYGFKAARKAVITGFGLQILATLVFWLVLISPRDPAMRTRTPSPPSSASTRASSPRP